MAKHIRSGVSNETIIRNLVIVSKNGGSMDDLANAVGMTDTACRSRVAVLRKKFRDELNRELPELSDGRKDRKIDMGALAALLGEEGTESEDESGS